MALDFLGTVILFERFNAHPREDGPFGPDDPQFTKRILCEGDSWFSVGALPSSNLLENLRFKQETLLWNLARSGDTIKHMSSIQQNDALVKHIREHGFRTKWDAILLSGGGNDVFDNFKLIVPTPTSINSTDFNDYINFDELKKIKKTIQDAYTEIANLRVGSVDNENTPILTHVYDTAIPRNSPAKAFGGAKISGPWLYKALTDNKIPKGIWNPLVKYIFKYLSDALFELEHSISNFHVVNTTGTLNPANENVTGVSGDWMNEIHPSSTGYAKLAAVISPELQKLL